jgi:hypothetical protein
MNGMLRSRFLASLGMTGLGRLAGKVMHRMIPKAIFVGSNK